MKRTLKTLRDMIIGAVICAIVLALYFTGLVRWKGMID